MVLGFSQIELQDLPRKSSFSDVAPGAEAAAAHAAAMATAAAAAAARDLQYTCQASTQ